MASKLTSWVYQKLAVRVDVITDFSEKDIPKQFLSLFQGLDKNTTFSSTAICYYYPPLRAKVQQELDRMIALEVIS